MKDEIKYYNGSLDVEATLTKGEFWDHIFGDLTPLGFVRNCDGLPIGVSTDTRYNHCEDPLKNMIYSFVWEFTSDMAMGKGSFIIDLGYFSDNEVEEYRATLRAWIEEALLAEPAVNTFYSQINN